MFWNVRPVLNCWSIETKQVHLSQKSMALLPKCWENTDYFNSVGSAIHSSVACFANARTVEARSLETGAQQKKHECL
jgi:hypothetical protein